MLTSEARRAGACSNNADERGDLALCQGVKFGPAGRTDHVLQAVAAAVDLAARDLDGPQVFDDAYDGVQAVDRKSTRLNSSHANISYAVFCLKKNKTGITCL